MMDKNGEGQFQFSGELLRKIFDSLSAHIAIMSKKVEDYTERDDERNEGHVDTRNNNFECKNPDKHLGCDPGIDVAG